MKDSLCVLSFADLVADVLIEIPSLPAEPAVHQVVKDISLEPGGAGNFLIAGQRLGIAMVSLAVVGNDFYGLEMVKILEEEGVDIEEVVFQQEDGTTVVFVLEDERKQHVFLGKYGVGSPVALTPGWKKKIEKADAVHFWGYSLLEERITNAFFDAMHLAHKHHKLISFDPGPLMGQAPPDTCKKILDHVDLILLTEEEIPSMVAGQTNLTAAKQLLTQGPEIICVKMGANGCVVFTREESVEHAGYPVKVSDTAAAGDSFNAAFLFGYLRGWPLRRIASFANAMGAAKVQKFGSGRRVPTLHEVKQVLAEFGESIADFDV